jgi:C4-dicarboxylate transporter, DctM subunit
VSPALFALLAFVAILLLSFAGVPIGVAIIVAAAVGILAATGPDMMLVILQTLPYATAADYDFLVVPMFILMGNIAASTGMLEQAFFAANRWLSSVRGGLYGAVTLASAAFGASSGSSVVNAAVFTRMALPEMMRLGYHKVASAACIAAAGTFAVMIPPSLAFVLYGIMTNESVGKLFLAGIVPGLLTAVVYMLAIPLLVRLKPDWAPPPQPKHPLGERMRSLKTLWPMALLIGIVMGGIFTGTFPASAAGAIGVAGALMIALAQRKLSLKVLRHDVLQAITMTGAVFLTIVAGFLFSRFLIQAGAVADMQQWVRDIGLTATQFIIFVALLYLVLGILLDGASLAVLTLPVIYPIARDLGMDGIWFGVLFVKLVEIDSITPPFGLNLFTVVAASQGRVDLKQVIRAVWPFVLIEYAILLLLFAFPAVSLWLPTLATG